MDVIGG